MTPLCGDKYLTDSFLSQSEAGVNQVLALLFSEKINSATKPNHLAFDCTIPTGPTTQAQPRLGRTLLLHVKARPKRQSGMVC